MNLDEPVLSTPEPSVDSENGRSISVQTRYQLLRPLGSGGMAVVHLAAIEREDGFSRNVALKIVREDYANFPEFMQMFAEEASLAAKLTHPNIVGIFDYCRDESARPFLVMEVVEGISLRKILHQNPPMPLSVVVFVMAEALRGLGYAHQLQGKAKGIRGLLHRDISPHNILLSWEGAVKITDFGIAKALLTTSGIIPGSDTASGKPAYMSPEQVRNQSLDRRSDLFSLGIVFWEMLTGKKLFDRHHPSEIFGQIATGPIPLPSHRRPVPKELERITMRLLERDPGRRYACAEDVLTDLARCKDMTGNGASDLVALLAERFPPYARSGREDWSEEQTPSDTPSEAVARETLVDADLATAPRTLGRRWAWGTALAAVAVAVAAAMILRSPAEPAPAAAVSPAIHAEVSMEGTALPLSSASLGPTAVPQTDTAASARAEPARKDTSAPQDASAERRSKRGPRVVPKAPASSPPAPSGILNVRFDGKSTSP
jgi:serine/threonine protein kinase